MSIIWWGLYFKNIALFIFFNIIILLILKKKYKINNLKTIFIILIIIFLYSRILYLEYRFQNLYSKINNEEFIGEIVSIKEEKEYINSYIIKIIEVNGKTKFKISKLILYTDLNTEYKYGDIVKINGEYRNAQERTNYKGFNYRQYLKQKNIFGILNSEKSKKIDEKKSVFSLLNNLNESLSSCLDSTFSKEESGILKAMLLGNKNSIDENTQEVFQNSSLAHILAISGLHINYIEFILRKILDTFINSKRKKDLIIICFLIIFCIFTGLSNSCIRACFMICFSIIGQMIYRKVNKVNSICFALLFILFFNPYSIYDMGLQLSFGGIIGLNLFKEIIKIKNTDNKIINYIVENLNTSLAVQIVILPIILYHFNKLSLTFFISNILVSILILPLLVLGYLSIIIIKFNLSFFISIIYLEKILLKIFLDIANFISKINISKILIVTPNILTIVIYYLLVLFVTFYGYKLKNKINKIIICILIFVVIFTNFNLKFNQNLEINFIDVGQGDSCLIISPLNKKILIDAGEGGPESIYDYGKNVVLPYLLDRKISSLDYIMVSHFDSDHAGGVIEILENISVKNLIIAKQFEENECFKKVIEICNKKKINIIIVKAGDVLKIDKYLKFRILWPSNEIKIEENQINNNSIITRLECFNFKMLFTGDIEQVAEKAILNKYNESILLKSNVLKVAHHGSKTSTTEEFLKKVNPKIVLIGVGKDNKFGHPNDEVLERIQKYRDKSI